MEERPTKPGLKDAPVSDRKPGRHESTAGSDGPGWRALRLDTRPTSQRRMAELAHELRNPLAALTQAVSELAACDSMPAAERTLARIALEEAHRLARLVTRVAARDGDAAELRRVELPEVVARTLALFRKDPRLSPEVRVEVGMEADLPALALDADRLVEALWNLLLNALAAVGRGGRIAVAARRAEWRGRAGIELAVSDSGPGVPAPVRQAVRGGRAPETGLGLAQVRGAAELHGGALRIEDGEAGGARVSLWLPVGGVKR